MMLHQFGVFWHCDLGPSKNRKVGVGAVAAHGYWVRKELPTELTIEVVVRRSQWKLKPQRGRAAGASISQHSWQGRTQHRAPPSWHTAHNTAPTCCPTRLLRRLQCFHFCQLHPGSEFDCPPYLISEWLNTFLHMVPLKKNIARIANAVQCHT